MDQPTFDIIAGFHSGVTRKLDKQTYRIGSAPGADIVLRDPGVEPEHALLCIENYGARVEAVGGDVSVGAELLTKGYGCRLDFPFELALGQARVRLTGAAKPSVMRPVSDFIADRPLAAGGSIVAAVLLLALVAGRSSSNADMSPRLGGVADSSMTAPDTNDATRKLNERLAQAGIQGLSIKALDGRVAVSGIIPNSAVASWTATQQWFDQTYKGRLTLTAAVAVGEGKTLNSKMRLQAVWFGVRPYLITEDGVRRYEGGALPDGWLIQEIRDNHIKLVKDGQVLTLTYR